MRAALIVVLSLAACTEPPVPVTDPPDPSQLVRVDTEPMGANCAEGGVAIHTGHDLDDSGALETEEITQTTYLCKPTAQPPQKAQTATEPAGPNCPHGGLRIEVGVDADANGILAGSEITSRSYACSAGPGHDAVVRTEIEYPGINCAGGGTVLLAGADLDDDGVLDDDEIQSTTYLCGEPPLPTVIEGNVILRNSYDASRLLSVTSIEGDLTVESYVAIPVRLPNLKSVAGYLNCFPCGAVDFRSLEVVGSLEGPAPYPFLVRGSITTLSLPALKVANLEVSYAPDFVSVHVGASESVFLRISSPSQLATVDLTGSRSISLDITHASTLTSFQAPTLVEAHLRLDGTSLQTLDLPAMQMGSLSLAGNPLLTSLSAPQLTELYEFTVYNNPMLATCAMQALAVQGNAPNPIISDNDDAATCP